MPKSEGRSKMVSRGNVINFFLVGRTCVQAWAPLRIVVTIMHKTGPFTNSGVSKFVKLVAVYTKHQQLNI